MDHHWQFHVKDFVEGLSNGMKSFEREMTRTEEIQARARIMPTEAMLEVVADWLAADLAYSWPPKFPDQDWKW